jgi:hypothetical protein
MATQKQIETSRLYAKIMTEIKLRIGAINTGTMNLLPVPPPFVREFCFLQIRMICELIALGCLTAHGDITATRSHKLQKAWKADEIIERLEALHTNFFPIPVIQGKNEMGHTVDPKTPNPLVKAEFLRLYRKCGGALHRGSVRKFVSEKTPVQIHYPEITALAQKLQDLLSVHMVSMLGGEMVFICVLFNRNDNMNVQVAIAEAMQPQSVAAGGSNGIL